MSKFKVLLDSLSPHERAVFLGALMMVVGIMLLGGLAMAGQSFANGQTLAGLVLSMGGLALFLHGKENLR